MSIKIEQLPDGQAIVTPDLRLAFHEVDGRIEHALQAHRGARWVDAARSVAAGDDLKALINPTYQELHIERQDECHARGLLVGKHENSKLAVDVAVRGPRAAAVVTRYRLCETHVAPAQKTNHVSWITISDGLGLQTPLNDGRASLRVASCRQHWYAEIEAADDHQADTLQFAYEFSTPAEHTQDP
jgi:hypothetical protein